MAEIRSPFNFVPLNNKVFYPDWADKISQDVPFADGISGSIDVTIKAETPIFVRNGHNKQEGKDRTGNYCHFSKYPDGRYYIPGTTVKGAIRSVLEILSYGKVHVDENAMFARPHLDPGAKRKTETIHCGWLKKTDGKGYSISVCKGNPKRIALWEIDEMFDTDVMKKHFHRSQRFNLNQEYRLGNVAYDPKSAVFKYALLDALTDVSDFEHLTFSYGEKNTYYFDPDGELEGTLVLTGQPDQRNNWKGESYGRGVGKWKEFIFPDEIDHELDVDTELFECYKFLYKDSPDWIFKSKQLERRGIPVFFRESKGKLIDMGLTYMYKVPYKNLPKDLAAKYEDYRMKNHEEVYYPDLSECMLGYSTKLASLRGRVQFSNFVSENAKEEQEYRLVLNGPKASYYPLYIRQDQGRNGIVNEYKTYADDSSELSGRKRYVMRKNIWQKKTNSDKLDTIIYPLKSGTVFSGCIYFHNLKGEELGALLSALTFHGNNNCRHQMGQAKPYGFGKVSLNVNKLKVPSYQNKALYDKDYYMSLFEQMMLTRVTPSWLLEEPLRELFTLSSVDVQADDKKFQYMEMSMIRGKNEFENAKNGKLYLHHYSTLVHQNVCPESRLDKYKDMFDTIQKNIKTEKASLEKQKAAEADAARTALIQQIAGGKKKEEEDKKAARAKNGLRELEEKKVGRDEYKIVSFKQASNKIGNWMKAVNIKILPQEQYEFLWHTLQRLHAAPDKKEKKEWGNFDSKLWKGIIAYTSESQAREWFDKLNV